MVGALAVYFSEQDTSFFLFQLRDIVRLFPSLHLAFTMEYSSQVYQRPAHLKKKNKSVSVQHGRHSGSPCEWGDSGPPQAKAQCDAGHCQGGDIEECLEILRDIVKAGNNIMFVRCCESQLVTGWRDVMLCYKNLGSHSSLLELWLFFKSHIYLKETLLLLLTGNPTSGRRQGRKEEGEASPGKMYRHNHWRQLDGSRPCCLPCHGHRCLLLRLQEPLLCRDEEVVSRGLQGPLKDGGWS